MIGRTTIHGYDALDERFDPLRERDAIALDLTMLRGRGYATAVPLLALCAFQLSNGPFLVAERLETPPIDPESGRSPRSEPIETPQGVVWLAGDFAWSGGGKRRPYPALALAWRADTVHSMEETRARSYVVFSYSTSGGTDEFAWEPGSGRVSPVEHTLPDVPSNRNSDHAWNPFELRRLSAVPVGSDALATKWETIRLRRVPAVADNDSVRLCSDAEETAWAATILVRREGRKVRRGFLWPNAKAAPRELPLPPGCDEAEAGAVSVNGDVGGRVRGPGLAWSNALWPARGGVRILPLARPDLAESSKGDEETDEDRRDRWEGWGVRAISDDGLCLATEGYWRSRTFIRTITDGVRAARVADVAVVENGTTFFMGEYGYLYRGWRSTIVTGTSNRDPFGKGQDAWFRLRRR